MPAPTHTPLERRIARKIAKARGLAPNEPAVIGHPLSEGGGSTAFDKAWWGYLPLAQALVAIFEDAGVEDEEAEEDDA